MIIIAGICAYCEVQTLGRLCVHATYQQNQRRAYFDRSGCATREYTIADSSDDNAVIGVGGSQREAHFIEHRRRSEENIVRFDAGTILQFGQ